MDNLNRVRATDEARTGEPANSQHTATNRTAGSQTCSDKSHHISHEDDGHSGLRISWGKRYGATKNTSSR